MRSGIGGDSAVAVTFNTMKQDGEKIVFGLKGWKMLLFLIQTDILYIEFMSAEC